MRKIFLAFIALLLLAVPATASTPPPVLWTMGGQYTFDTCSRCALSVAFVPYDDTGAVLQIMARNPQATDALVEGLLFQANASNEIKMLGAKATDEVVRLMNNPRSSGLAPPTITAAVAMMKMTHSNSTAKAASTQGLGQETSLSPGLIMDMFLGSNSPVVRENSATQKLIITSTANGDTHNNAVVAFIHSGFSFNEVTRMLTPHKEVDYRLLVKMLALELTFDRSNTV